MLKSIKVRDYMTRHLVTFRSDTDLFTAINRLLEHRISGAPVVDSQGHLIGLLSEGDCLRGILSGAYYESVGGTVTVSGSTIRISRLARSRFVATSIHENGGTHSISAAAASGPSFSDKACTTFRRLCSSGNVPPHSRAVRRETRTITGRD